MIKSKVIIMIKSKAVIIQAIKAHIVETMAGYRSHFLFVFDQPREGDFACHHCRWIPATVQYLLICMMMKTSGQNSKHLVGSDMEEVTAPEWAMKFSGSSRCGHVVKMVGNSW